MKWNEYTWYSKWASLIFFIAVFPILAFYIGGKYQEVKDAQTITNSGPTLGTTKVAPHSINSEDILNTVNWKNYINSKYNFKFQYPPQFVIQHQDDNSVQFANSNKCALSAQSQSPGEYVKGCQYISVLFQNNKIISGGVSQNINIFNHSWEKIIMPENPAFSVLGQTLKSNKWYIVTITSNIEDKDASLKLFDQVTSTIIFTDENDTINPTVTNGY